MMSEKPKAVVYISDKEVSADDESHSKRNGSVRHEVL